MSVESVKKQFENENIDLKIIEFTESTATVELAASALGVEPDRIAKSIALSLRERNILVIAKGGAKIDNRKYKDYFGEKARMMPLESVEEATGHPVGGVCPFGLKEKIDIYLDESLKEFDIVYPAAGSPNSAVKITPDYLCEVTGGIWVDVCK
jgi:Cys-tRNA(Pro) deacylase